jgi:hypothetical protein
MVVMKDSTFITNGAAAVEEGADLLLKEQFELTTSGRS